MTSRLWAAALVPAAVVACAVPQNEVQQRQVEMLNPTVRVEVQGGTGSGTVIRSDDRGTFIITNHHVAGDAVKAKASATDCSKEPDDRAKTFCELGKSFGGLHRALMGDAEQKNIVQVRFWLLNSRSETVLSVLRDAEVVASDAERDLALLRLVDTEFRAEAVARIAPADVSLAPGEDVFVAGAALGLRAHLTEGLLSLPSAQLQGRDHVVSSAPVVFGNSGGGMYHRSASGHFEYIATVRAIAMVGFGAPVTTTNYAIPNKSLREFLAGNGYGDLV